MTIDLKNATIELYEISSLTEELTDHPAQILLKWGELQLQRLAEKNPNDIDLFESNFKSLRGIIKSINRFTWRRQEMTAEEMAEFINKRITQRGQAIGLPITPERVTDYLAQQATLEEEGNVRAMIALLEPVTYAQAAALPENDAELNATPSVESDEESPPPPDLSSDLPPEDTPFY